MSDREGWSSGSGSKIWTPKNTPEETVNPMGVCDMVRVGEMTVALSRWGVFRNKYDWTCSQRSHRHETRGREEGKYPRCEDRVKDPDVGVQEVYSGTRT